MAHSFHQGMVARDEYFVPTPVEPSVLGHSVLWHRPSGPPSNMTIASCAQKKAPPPPVKKPRSKSLQYVCRMPDCREKFSCVENLDTHMKLHQGVKPFACDVCGKVCQTQSRLNTHQATHASDGVKPKCDICERNFSSNSALKKHKKMLHKPKPHVCPRCNSGFEERRYMVIHAKRAHDEDLPAEVGEHPHALQMNYEQSNFYVNPDLSVNEGKNTFKDNYCTPADGNTLPESSAATSPYDCQKEQDKLRQCDANNLQRKPGLCSVPITCEMCTSTFPSVSYLEQHMEVHVGEKSFTCQHCDMKFTNRQLLSNHLKLHTFEPQPLHGTSFPTSFTNESFTQYAPHPVQPPASRSPPMVRKYICALCNEQFLNLGSLKRHQAKGHATMNLSI